MMAWGKWRHNVGEFKKWLLCFDMKSHESATVIAAEINNLLDLALKETK